MAFYYGVKAMYISQEVFHDFIAERFPIKALPSRGYVPPSKYYASIP